MKLLETFLLTITIFMTTKTVNSYYGDEGLVWTWTCDVQSGLCKRTDSDSANPKNSLPLCMLTCGTHGALWPKPTILTKISSAVIAFNTDNVDFDILGATTTKAEAFLLETTKIFLDNLLTECADKCKTEPNAYVLIFLTITNSDLTLNWQTNEAYKLDIETDGLVRVEIEAETVYGVRHGLETLTQLITSYPIQTEYDDDNPIRELVMVTNAKIQDKPIYKHRGLLLDTARNFLPVKAIERQIDAMAASKLNVLHWHATDSQSFPLESPSLPNMTRFGAFSPKMVYTPTDVYHLLDYARLRGVRIILEIDSPSHAGNGWQWGKAAGFGDLAVCVNRQPWRSYCMQPPCGQLNPVNPNLYNVLGKLYGDFIEMFPKGEAFHMGGDEVFFACWNTTDEIVERLKKAGRETTLEDFIELWGFYQRQALNVFDKQAGRKDTPIIMWSSDLTDPKRIEKYLDKSRYVIQTWVPSYDELPKTLISMGYKLIISTKNAWYLDHGWWGSTTYYNWTTVYKNRLPQDDGVLGGEVCMWGERVDENNIDSKVWARAAAAAERLWSDPVKFDLSTEARYSKQRERLISRGIQAEAFESRWCFQNEGEC